VIRRIALATAYTLLVAALLLTWEAAITRVPLARWLLILTPFYWGWVAFHLQPGWARRVGLAGSVVLFIACFLFVTYQDGLAAGCLWNDGRCGPGWFYWYGG
jgi:hypothetical protein